MREPLIATLDATGLSCAAVPFPCMWDLVEYLSYQRVAVTYQYHASHFTVTLPRMDVASAQRILDEWVHAGPSEMQTACCRSLSGSVHSSDPTAPPAMVLIGVHAAPESNRA